MLLFVNLQLVAFSVESQDQFCLASVEQNEAELLHFFVKTSVLLLSTLCFLLCASCWLFCFFRHSPGSGKGCLAVPKHKEIRVSSELFVPVVSQC